MASTEDPKLRLKNAESFYQYGSDAVTKENYDYAIQMFADACKLVPEELKYRMALRGTERRKLGNDPSKVGRLVGARTQPIKGRARLARSQGKYAHAIEICEEAFVLNPWDVGAAWEGAESAEQLGMLRLAQWLLESVQAQADDAEFFRYQAHIHERNEDWQKAISSWDRVKKLAPDDETANRKINALSASATITRSGLKESIEQKSGGGQSAQVEAPSGPDAAELKRLAMSPEDRYRQEIRDDPTRVGSYLGLADHHKLRGQLDEAEQVLGAGLKAVPGDSVLQGAYAEVQISRLKRAVDGWTRKVQKDPDDAAARGKLEQLTRVLNDYEIKELRRRSALQPDDTGLRYQIGCSLARAGKHDEAIAEFQQARNSPEWKVRALHQAGLSFEANDVPKLAERSYQEALKAADGDDDATRNALHYRLGRLAESMGNHQAAEEHYNEVAANDYAYEDVAKRLRALNQRSGT